MLKDNSKKSILFCGHGSNDIKYQNEFSWVVKYIAKKNKDCTFFKCFIEINRPSITEFFKKFSSSENVKLFVFPMLIFKGNHLEIDIKQHIPKNKNIKLCKSIDLNNKVLEVYKNNIRINIKSSEIVIITICSFSKNPNVLNELKTYTKMLSENFSVIYYDSCYYGFEHKVFEKLKKVKNKKNIDLVIHPIFLFTGFLYKSVKKKFEYLKFKNIIVTKPLMKEPMIVDILSQKVAQFTNS